MRALPNFLPGPGRDETWDEVLDAVDRYLALVEVRHLELVAAAGCSGPEVVAKLARLRADHHGR